MPSEISIAGADYGREPTIQELKRELAEAQEQQAATADILRVISSSPMDLQRVFADIAASAARLCNAYDVVIRQMDGDILRLVAHYGPIPIAGTMPLSRGVFTARLVLDRRTIHVADLQAETDAYPESSDNARDGRATRPPKRKAGRGGDTRWMLGEREGREIVEAEKWCIDESQIVPTTPNTLDPSRRTSTARCSTSLPPNLLVGHVRAGDPFSVKALRRRYERPNEILGACVRIVISLVLLFISLPSQAARGESAKVYGFIDCNFLSRGGEVWVKSHRLSGASPINPEESCAFVGGLDGYIDAGTLRNLTEMFGETRGERRTRNIIAQRFKLNSPGGNLRAAMAIGHLLRKERISVYMGEGAVCYSACVLVLAGAPFRAIAGGKVGIHRPHLENPPTPLSPEELKQKYSHMLRMLRAYLREVQVSESLADDMMKIPSDRIRYLETPELDKYGLGEVDTIMQETTDIAEARRLGIDLSQYTRRKLMTQRCPSQTYIDCYNRIMRLGR